jgi:small subunit ribosomal protein S1
MVDTLEKKQGMVVDDDFFEKLKNENKVFKYKSKDKHATLTDDYLFFLKKLEEDSKTFKQIEEGEVVEGKIVEVNGKEIIIDINFKDTVFVESKTIDKDMFENLHAGEPIKVMITEISDEPYYIKGSLNDLLKLNISNVVKEHFNENIHFFATVKESQPAGYYLNLEVDGQIVDAFMPNTLAGVNKLHDPTSIVGEKFEVMIETLEQDKGVYVVSRKKYLENLIPERIKQLKKEWIRNKNKVYDGIVTGSTPFGVFIEFCEYLTCMIHRYNVNPEWQPDEKWSTLKPGMTVPFYIKDIITRKNKVIATQILRESLWDTIKVDDVVKGKVISIKPFGALIQLDDETNGLIQNTYLQKNKIDLTMGQEIEVRVTSIMKDERKINLSLVKL